MSHLYIFNPVISESECAPFPPYIPIDPAGDTARRDRVLAMGSSAGEPAKEKAWPLPN